MNSVFISNYLSEFITRIIQKKLTNKSLNHITNCKLNTFAKYICIQWYL